MERDECGIIPPPTVTISTHTLTWSVTFGIKELSQDNGISTHTLTWSVTSCQHIRQCTVGNFNSHAHVERDDSFEDNTFYVNISTHTLTWSVTTSQPNRQRYIAISTHTLTWSVTNKAYETSSVKIFQLTRSRGA